MDDYRAFMVGLLANAGSGPLVLRLNDATGATETVEAYDMLRVGDLLTTMNPTDPGLTQAQGGLGYGAWVLFAQGRALVGVDAGDTDWDTPGETRGAKTVTPAGSVSAPTFTGSALGTHTHTFTGNAVASDAVSAGTPAGAVAAPTFTGTAALATSAVTAGTPAGTVASHAHELPLQLSSTTATRQIAAATFGTGTSRAATGASAAGSANTTSAAVALSQAVAPAFTGSALGAHSHTLTPTGTNSAPTFTGNALATHSHTTTATGANTAVSAGTPAGSVSAPTFTGAALDVRQPSIAVYVWRRVS